MMLGGGMSAQNDSLWQKITSEPRSAARATDTSDTAPSLASFEKDLFPTLVRAPEQGNSKACHLAHRSFPEEESKLHFGEQQNRKNLAPISP